MALIFTPAELQYLDSQLLGRLATVDPSGAPQNNPVSFSLDDDQLHLTIGGFRMAASRKYRNVAGNEHVAFVVDDLASTNPWTPRCLEIRGTAEAVTDAEPPQPSMTHDVIRITPTWIHSFGINAEEADNGPRTT